MLEVPAGVAQLAEQPTCKRQAEGALNWLFTDITACFGTHSARSGRGALCVPLPRDKLGSGHADPDRLLISQRSQVRLCALRRGCVGCGPAGRGRGACAEHDKTRSPRT
jgi:hypothetical protein